MKTHLKNYIFFLIFFIIIIENVDAAGIAISPSNMTLNMSRDDNIEKSIIIYNLGEEQSNISINIEGDIDKFITIYDNNIDIKNITILGNGTKKIKVKFHIPENVNITNYSGNILTTGYYKYNDNDINIGVKLPININVQDKKKKLYGFSIITIIAILFMTNQFIKCLREDKSKN